MLWSHVSNELEKRKGGGNIRSRRRSRSLGIHRSRRTGKWRSCKDSLLFGLGVGLVGCCVVLCCVVLCCVKMFVSLVIERTDRGRERGPLYRELVVTPSSREGSLMRDRRAGSE